MPGIRAYLKGFLTILSFTLSSAIFAIPPMNLPSGVTPIGKEIYWLHMFAFYICVAIGVVVFAVLIYSLVRFRRSKGFQAHEDLHEHLGIELLWTIIPFILLVIMAIPATRLLMDIHDTKKPALDVKVTGYQWKWQYEYLDQGISFFSNLSTPQNQVDDEKITKDPWYLLEVDHPLVLPIHEKIRFLITSNDVIHSWWVPDLGIKQDAIPGYINDAWAIIEKPGVYRGQCAELCGAMHAFMPIVIKAVSPQEFQQWVAEQRKVKFENAAEVHQTLTHEELMTLGKENYDKYCAACHKADGTGMPPTFPALKGDKVVTGPLSEQLNVVLNGVQGTAMQAFGTQLDDKILAAIITYQRNAWGNDAINQEKKLPVTVQPSDVAQARQKGEQ